MAEPIELPKWLRNQGWKIKIYDNERLEEPHITLICREKTWRISLRNRSFLIPPGGRWKDIDEAIRRQLEDEESWKKLQDTWDQKHPTNPISSQEEEDA